MHVKTLTVAQDPPICGHLQPWWYWEYHTHVTIHHKGDYLYNVISFELAVAIKLYNLGVTKGMNVHCYYIAS